MAKRSTNFNSPKFRPQVGDLVSLVNWLGMSEAECQVVFRGAALFVNINGEETVPATIKGGSLNYGNRSASYKSTDIHAVDDGEGLVWYEINDTDLLS